MTDILKKRRRRGPCTHALVIGVSHYRHFDGGAKPTARGESWGMGQLTSAAASAAEVAAWLSDPEDGYHNPDAPLQTLRVLVSPQKRERLPKRIADAVKGPAFRATRDNVERALTEFKEDCESNVDNVGFVYIVGHGVQLSKHDAIVLLEDLGDPKHATTLKGAIDAVGCHRGMDHSATASTQFWFVDACRQRPEVAEEFETMTGALTLDELPGQAASSPLFLASATREAAFARPGKRTLFCEGLLEALRGHAAIGPDHRCPDWHVSTLSLNEKLTEIVARLAAAEGKKQTVVPRGSQAHAVVQRFRAPPEVRLTVDVRPTAAARSSTAALLAGGSAPVPDVPRKLPFEMSLAAGLYLLAVETRPPYKSTSAILNLVPPAVVHSARV